MKYAVDHNFYKLRTIIDDDHEWMISLHNDPEVLKNMTHSTPVTIGSHLKWWKQVSEDPRQLRLIFEVGGDRAGLAKFYNIDEHNLCCVLGGDIHKDFRGKGHGKMMWMLMLSRCFDDFNLHRVSLTTAEYNAVGRHIYEKLGFKEEGLFKESLWRDGRFHDQVLMFMLKRDWQSMEDPR